MTEITKMMNKEAEKGPVNKERKKVIAELEEVLNFLKGAQITDEHVLNNIKEPLSDLRSSLKYIPTETPFEMIPTEIKTKILSYLCDTNAFTAASVCAEWKEILESRFTENVVTIGKRTCSYQCRDITKHSVSLENSNMLEAAATHKIDVHLSIDHSVREVDSKIITEALTSVSSFSIFGDCECDFNDDMYVCDIHPLSVNQLEELFKGLEKKVEGMECVELVCLDLTELNQDRLANYFVNKIKNLWLCESKHHGDEMFSMKTFVKKLSQKSAEFKLNQLSLEMKSEELALELTNALCNVENVKLYSNMRLESVKQLIENILTDTRPVVIKNLIIWETIDYRTLINPEDLKKLCNKMVTLRLVGQFTVEQLEAARSLPEVAVSDVFSEEKYLLIEEELFTKWIEKGL